MAVWFSADYHLGHTNIIKYCSRPFNNVEEMNDTIIKNHNSVVKPNDIVYFLGDFAFGNGYNLINKMNGHFSMIRGNHDRTSPQLRRSNKSGIFEHNDLKLYMCHRPIDIVPGYDLNLTAHVHQHWVYRDGINALNVGVDAHNFFPVSLDEVLTYVKKEK